jgi:hypothetical protein
MFRHGQLTQSMQIQCRACLFIYFVRWWQREVRPFPYGNNYCINEKIRKVGFAAALFVGTFVALRGLIFDGPLALRLTVVSGGAAGALGPFEWRVSFLRYMCCHTEVISHSCCCCCCRNCKRQPPVQPSPLSFLFATLRYYQDERDLVSGVAS